MKKICMICVLILGLFCLTGCFFEKKSDNTNKEIIEECNEPKCDSIPNWMISKPRNDNDYDVAKKFIEEIEQKHNTTFNIIGYNYFVNYVTVDDKYMRDYILTGINVYSDEYPQVYVRYCFNKEYCDNTEETEDNYLNEINWWKQKNSIYDIAAEIGIDTNSIAVYVGPNYDNTYIGGDLLVNSSISIDSIESLLKNISDKLNKENVSFKIYLVEKGNNKEFKKHLDGIGVTENWLDLNFGSWKRYKCTISSGVYNMSLEYEHK